MSCATTTTPPPSTWWLAATAALLLPVALSSPVFHRHVHDTPAALLNPWQGMEEDLLAAHCHAPRPLQNTYQPVPGAHHISSYLFVRHGDRTPNVLMPEESDMSYQCDMVDNYMEEIPAQNGEGLMGGLVKSKWTVINPEPSENPHSRVMWRGNCHVGQLTDVGARQHVELGRELGKIYGITSTQEVDGRTSTFWRTRQSAQSILAGLFDPEVRPDINFDTDTPVSLNVTAHESENMVPQSPLCPKVQALHHNRDHRDETFSSWWRMQHDDRVYFDRIMGTSQTHGGEKSGTLEKYFDTITARSCHNPEGPGRFPDIVGQRNEELPKGLMKKIVLGANWEILYQYKRAPSAEKFIRLVLGSFLGQVMDRMEMDGSFDTRSRQPPPPKLHIYSAHDTTISPLLGALKIEDSEFFWPPYASNVLFEMFELEDADPRMDPLDRKIVRVIYNGRVIRSGGRENTDQCVGGSCIRSEWSECDLGACPLSIFMNRFRLRYVPESPEEYNAECHIAPH